MQGDRYTDLSFYYIGNYKVEGITLGKGNFAKVLLGTHKVIGAAVALKVIDMTKIKEHYVEKNLEREAKILARLNHPNIVKLYETTVCHQLYCLSLEFIRGGELREHIRNHPGQRLGEVEARNLFYQIISAVGHMHRNGVLHRDLKLENILMADHETIKLVDFGLSNFYQSCCPLRTRCGSPEYAAPELFNTEAAYGTGVDVWSAGVVLYVMVVGKVPFRYPKREASTVEGRRKILYEKSSKGLVDEHHDDMKQLTTACQDILRRMLEPNQNVRLTIEGIEQHGWMTSFPPPPPPAVTLKPALYQEIHNTVMRRLVAVTQMSARDLENRIHRSKFGKVYAMYHLMRDCMIKNHLNPVVDASYGQTWINRLGWVGGYQWKIPARSVETRYPVPQANGQRSSRNQNMSRQSLPKDRVYTTKGCVEKTCDQNRHVGDTFRNKSDDSKMKNKTNNKSSANPCGDLEKIDISHVREPKVLNIDAKAPPSSNLSSQGRDEKRIQSKNPPLINILGNNSETIRDSGDPRGRVVEPTGDLTADTGTDNRVSDKKNQPLTETISRLTITDQNSKVTDGKKLAETPRKTVLTASDNSKNTNRCSSRSKTTEDRPNQKSLKSGNSLLSTHLPSISEKAHGDHDRQQLPPERPYTVLQKETVKTGKPDKSVADNERVCFRRRTEPPVVVPSSLKNKQTLKGPHVGDDTKSRESSTPKRDSAPIYALPRVSVLPPIKKTAPHVPQSHAATDASNDSRNKQRRNQRSIEATSLQTRSAKPLPSHILSGSKPQPLDDSGQQTTQSVVPKRYSLTRTLNRNQKADLRNLPDTSAVAKQTSQDDGEKGDRIPNIKDTSNRTSQGLAAECCPTDGGRIVSQELDNQARTDEVVQKQSTEVKMIHPPNTKCTSNALPNSRNVPKATTIASSGERIPGWVSRESNSKPSIRQHYGNTRGQSKSSGTQVWPSSTLRGYTRRFEPLEQISSFQRDPLPRIPDSRQYGSRTYSNSHSIADNKGYRGQRPQRSFRS